MKTIIGALALTLAVPAFAQSAPATDPHASHKGMDHSQHQAAGQQQHQDHAKHMEEMHKHCQDMMRHHRNHGAKTSAETKGEHRGHAQ